MRYLNKLSQLGERFKPSLPEIRIERIGGSRLDTDSEVWGLHQEITLVYICRLILNDI